MSPLILEYYYDWLNNKNGARRKWMRYASKNGGTWAEFIVPYQAVYDKKIAIKNGSAAIWDYAKNVINESVEKGILRK